MTKHPILLFSVYKKLFISIINPLEKRNPNRTSQSTFTDPYESYDQEIIEQHRLRSKNTNRND
jgi:hypothetical protein